MEKRQERKISQIAIKIVSRISLYITKKYPQSVRKYKKVLSRTYCHIVRDFFEILYPYFSFIGFPSMMFLFIFI